MAARQGSMDSLLAAAAQASSSPAWPAVLQPGAPGAPELFKPSSGGPPLEQRGSGRRKGLPRAASTDTPSLGGIDAMDEDEGDEQPQRRSQRATRGSKRTAKQSQDTDADFIQEAELPGDDFLASDQDYGDDLLEESEGASAGRGKGKKKIGRPRKYDGPVDDPRLSEAERRRIKRRIANRESAARVRNRRTELIGELHKQVQVLGNQNEQLQQRFVREEQERTTFQARLQQMQTQAARMHEDNARLLAEVAQLRRSLQDPNAPMPPPASAAAPAQQPPSTAPPQQAAPHAAAGSANPPGRQAATITSGLGAPSVTITSGGGQQPLVVPRGWPGEGSMGQQGRGVSRLGTAQQPAYSSQAGAGGPTTGAGPAGGRAGRANAPGWPAQGLGTMRSGSGPLTEAMLPSLSGRLASAGSIPSGFLSAFGAYTGSGGSPKGGKGSAGSAGQASPQAGKPAVEATRQGSKSLSFASPGAAGMDRMSSLAAAAAAAMGSLDEQGPLPKAEVQEAAATTPASQSPQPSKQAASGPVQAQRQHQPEEQQPRQQQRPARPQRQRQHQPQAQQEAQQQDLREAPLSPFANGHSGRGAAAGSLLHREQGLGHQAIPATAAAQGSRQQLAAAPALSGAASIPAPAGPPACASQLVPAASDTASSWEARSQQGIASASQDGSGLETLLGTAEPLSSMPSDRLPLAACLPRMASMPDTSSACQAT